MKILTITTLFPNGNDAKHGVFVLNRLLQLLTHHPDIEVKVIAPVPWFPFKVGAGALARYAKYVDVPAREQVGGVDVLHPRYLVIPKVGMHLTPYFLRRAIEKAMRRLRNEGFDAEVIDGHYFFPDGVAVSRAAQRFGKPYVVTARGSDLSIAHDYPLAGQMVKEAAEHAGAIITVCQDLRDSLLRLIPVGDKTSVLRNGVDLDFFTPPGDEDRRRLREQWQIADGQTLIASVGNLIELKGHHLVIEAMRRLPEHCRLVIAGAGEERARLQQSVQDAALGQRVSFAGLLDQVRLRTLYQAADCLVLASSREGWANVLLESMACGTPVVATNRGGTPEVVTAPAAGVLVERTAEALATGIETVVRSSFSRADTRAYAEQFDWAATSAGQHRIFSELAGRAQA